jgi:hypothetical protein
MPNLTNDELSAIYSRMAKPGTVTTPQPGVNSLEFELASGLVRIIMNGRPGTMEALRQPTDEEVPENDRGQFALEEIIFCLHMVARLAFSNANVDKRGHFMDALVAGVGEVLWQEYGVGIEAPRFLEYFFGLYNSRSQEYSSYRDSTAEGESKKGELVWEYGKKVAALISPQKSASKVILSGWLAMRLAKRLIPIVRQVLDKVNYEL